MNKYIGLFLAAVIGGAASTGINQLMEDNDQIVAKEEATPKIENNHLASYPRVASEATVDFTRAAEHSVNSVVHVKTAVTAMVNEGYYHPFQYFFGQPAPKQNRNCHIDFDSRECGLYGSNMAF